MAYTINEDCINCTVCVYTCPAGAITEHKTTCVIDPEKCTDCGTCAEVCPEEIAAANPA